VTRALLHGDRHVSHADESIRIIGNRCARVTRRTWQVVVDRFTRIDCVVRRVDSALEIKGAGIRNAERSPQLVEKGSDRSRIRRTIWIMRALIDGDRNVTHDNSGEACTDWRSGHGEVIDRDNP
jgi:hypothetical protein